MQEWYLGWEKVVLVREVSSVRECPHRERGSTLYFLKKLRMIKMCTGQLPRPKCSRPERYVMCHVTCCFDHVTCCCGSCDLLF